MSGLDSDSDEDVFPGGRRDGEAARLLRQHAELVEKKRQEEEHDRQRSSNRNRPPSTFLYTLPSASAFRPPSNISLTELTELWRLDKKIWLLQEELAKERLLRERIEQERKELIMQLERMDEKQRELEEREYREKILHAIENPSPRKLSKYPRKTFSMHKPRCKKGVHSKSGASLPGKCIIRVFHQ